MFLTPCCLKSKVWKTSQAQAPRGSDHDRECAQRPGYLPWLCNHHSDQSRYSPTAEGRNTAHLSRRRGPEARKWIKDDSCAKLVSMELLFQTKSYSFVCVLLFDFIRPRLSPSLLLPSCHLRFLPFILTSHSSGWKISQITSPVQLQINLMEKLLDPTRN